MIKNMIKKNKEFLITTTITIIIIYLFNISFAYAADIDTFFGAVPKYIKVFTQIVIGLVMIALFWGFIQYMFQDKKEEGKGILVWGIIGLFIIFSVWAILFFMQRTTIGTNNGNMPTLPALR